MRERLGGRWPALLAVTCAATVALAGCGDAEPASARAPQLTAEIIQSNLDKSLGAVRVSVENHGQAAVRIDDLVLRAAPFPDRPSEYESVLLPGRRINFRVPYGTPDCTGADPGLGRVVAEIRAAGEQFVIDVDDSQNALAGLLEQLCGRQRLAEIADVTLGHRWTLTPDGAAAIGSIEIRRLSTGPAVALVKLGGSVVFTLQPVDERQPVAMLAGGQGAVSVPVRAVPVRCDPHALAEGKKNYVFPMWLTVDGEEGEIHVELQAELGVQNVMRTLCPG